MTELTSIQLANQVGYFLRKQGKSEAALRIFRALERYQPNHIYPTLGKGLVLAVQGAFPDAESAFRRVLELSPRHSFALVCLGLARLHQRKADWRSYMHEAQQSQDDSGGRELARDVMSWFDGAGKPREQMTVGATIARLHANP
ncbi:tetratricopeptide repeat protein [Burkholderia ubonensis]|uniref:tetratricopeptide repeat protein n=1 Tax=Burkholderia ubonensis TaxID=101571 RepID=UPI0007C709F2|nr:tetratricopeptide repeat protein [Burkholderia ubonensis]